MPNILISNDDGVHAAGIIALAKALDAIGNVVVLAPERNWSVAGHPKTLHKPLRVKPVRWPDGRLVYASNGAPSDCVALGVMGAVEEKFDLVVSGINNNYNLGSDVFYSGTVAAAMEANIHGIPAFAISLGSEQKDPDERTRTLNAAANIAARLADLVLSRGLPRHLFLNVNVPGRAPEELEGALVTRLGQRIYRDVLIRRDDPWGRPYFWIGGEMPTGVPEDGSDIGAVENGFVSVTPLGIDLTAYEFIRVLKEWGLEESLIS
jgi:5'-nucleotidase